MTDAVLAHASAQIAAARRGVPIVGSFFDEPTNTVT